MITASTPGPNMMGREALLLWLRIKSGSPPSTSLALFSTLLITLTSAINYFSFLKLPRELGTSPVPLAIMLITLTNFNNTAEELVPVTTSEIPAHPIDTVSSIAYLFVPKPF